MKEQSPATRRKKGDTRKRVLKAAAKLFATHGYTGTSISAICSASGVLTSSVYWEFGNKAGIFSAVLEDSAQRWLDQSTRSIVRAMRSGSGSSEDRLRAYFDYMAEALATGPEFFRLMMMVALERRHADPKALEIIHAHRARAIATIGRLLTAFGLEATDGVTNRDIAALTIACCDGAFISGQIDGDEADLPRTLNLLRLSLTASVLPPERSTPEQKR